MVRLDMPTDLLRQGQFVLSAEPFFNLRDTDWGAERGFLQNRSFVGMNFRVASKLRIETGYMNIFVRRRAAIDLSNHLFVINFRIVD